MQHCHTFGDTTWIDLLNPSDEELTELAERFDLSSRTFDEAHRRAARPTLQRFHDHAYVVAFSGTLAEIDMWIGPTWFVTVRLHDPRGREWTPTDAIERCKRKGDTITSGVLLATVLDQLIDGYFDTTDQLEDELEEIEGRIFDDEQPEQGVQKELFGVRRRLLELRRAVVPLREVLSAVLREEVEWVTGEALVICHDAFDKLLRAVDLVDEQRELLGNAVDAHLAVMSNQMNLVMKKLTAWGAILFGAALVAGIYGMNFTHMPELHWYYGYPLALATIVVISAVLYHTFRRRDWL